MNEQETKEWNEVAKEFACRGPLPKDKRVCAVCLLDVDRATYTEHMEGHGYTTLHVTAGDVLHV